MKTVESKASTLQRRTSSKGADHDLHGHDASFYSTPKRNAVQAKLTIGQANDKYEREADTMAGEVVQKLSTGQHPQYSIQPKCASCEQEENLQKKEELEDKEPLQRKLQRKPIFESDDASSDDDHLMRKCEQCEQEEPDSNATLESRLASSKGSGVPLSDKTRGSMEGAFDADFSNVRIHTGSEASAMSNQIGAQAFTHGRDIYFAEGKYDTESSSGKNLLAHELTHTLQQGAAVKTKPANNATRDINDAEENVVQRSIFDSVAGSLGAAWDATGGRLVDAAGNVVEMTEEFFWSLLSRVSPAAVQMIRKISQVGIVQFLKDEMKNAVNRIFDGLQNNTGFLGTLSPTFQRLIVQARAIITGLASGDCKPLFAALNQLKETLAELAGVVWGKITAFFEPIGEFFSDLWQSFGLPFVEWIKKTAGNVWEKIKGFGQLIWNWTAPLRNALAAAWDWVKRKLGLSVEETGEEGLIQWVQQKALEAWEKIKAELQPVIAPIMGLVNRVRALIPLDAILNLRETINAWLQKAVAMGNAMEADGIAQQQQQVSLRDEVLPGILQFIQKLRGRIIEAGAWVSEKIGNIGASVTAFFETIRNNVWLSPLSFAINWLQSGVNSLVGWAQGTVQQLFQFIGDALVYLSQFARPILDMVTKLLEVLKNLLGMLPDLLGGPIWWVMPDCIKEPVKKFILEQILSRIPFFKQLQAAGDVWVKLENAALFALKQVFVDGNLAGAIWTFFRTMLEIMNVPPKLVTGIISKGAAVLMDIINAPFQFLSNLLSALKGGLSRFFDNIWTHLLNGLMGWLTGQLEGTGVELPKSFSFKEIFKFVASLLGITLDKILEKIERVSGKKGLKAKIKKWIDKGAKALDWIMDLFSEGPAGVAKKLEQKLTDLWDTIFNSVAAWIQNTIIAKAIKWVAEKLDPTGIMAVITTVIDVMTVLETIGRQLRQILEIVNNVIDGIADIVKNKIDTAVVFIESVLAKAVPVALTFLSALLGLDGVGDKIKEVVKGIHEKVDQGLDWLAEKGKELIEGIKGFFGMGDDEDEGDIPEVNNDLDIEDKKIAPDGDITKEQAGEVAKIVTGKHSAKIKPISVVDGGVTWDYEYVQLAKKKGEKKEEGNAEYIKQFLNKPAPAEPPEGYNYYDEKDDGSMKIRRKEANEKFVKLGIESKDVPQGEPGETGVENIIVEGEEGGTARISKPGKLARAVGGSPKNHQFHHLIPDAVVRENQLTAEARTQFSYDLDHGGNGIRLPANEEGKKETSGPIHFGSHPNYNRSVNDFLNKRKDSLIKKFQTLGQVDKPTLESVVAQVESHFRGICEGSTYSKLN